MALQLVRSCCSSSLRSAAVALGTRCFSSADSSDQEHFNSILQVLKSSSSSNSQTLSEHQVSQPRPPTPASSPPAPSTSITPENPAEDKPYMRLVDSKFGYAVLGGINPSDSSDSSQSQWNLSMPKVNPLRDFAPGETYRPEDLNPFHQENRNLPSMNPTNRPPISNKAVYKQADYKDPEYLEQFVSSAGRLLPRKATRLKPAVHKHVMRQIKIARVMALMPHEARIGDEQRKRLREFEQLQSRNRVQQVFGGVTSEPAPEQPPVV